MRQNSWLDKKFGLLQKTGSDGDAMHVLSPANYKTIDYKMGGSLIWDFTIFGDISALLTLQ